MLMKTLTAIRLLFVSEQIIMRLLLYQFHFLEVQAGSKMPPQNSKQNLGGSAKDLTSSMPGKL